MADADVGGNATDGAEDEREECVADGAKGDCRVEPQDPFPTCGYHVDRFHSGGIYGDRWQQALEALDEFLDDPRWCSECFAKIRETDPARDYAEAVALSVGDTKLTFYARGHSLNEDGSVEAATSYQATPAAAIDDGTLYRGECGRPGGRADGKGGLSKGQLYDALAALYDAVDETVPATLRDEGRHRMKIAIESPNCDDRESLAHGLLDSLGPRRLY